jgi:hypothetical protein
MRVGNILGVSVAGGGRSGYPHATEDMRLTGTVNTLGALTESELYEICVETADASVAAIYGNNLAERKYVPESTQCRSLGCVLVPINDITVHVSFDKLRVQFRDATGAYFDPAVTEIRTRDAGNAEQQATALRARLQAYGNEGPIALRLGLTRAWAGPSQEFNPRRCTMQLNGIVGPA